MAKVIHIHLTHGIEGTKRKDWYFSSITAIYTVLTVCDTDMLKYHNFKNTPCFLFDSPPLKTYHFSRFTF